MLMSDKKQKVNLSYALPQSTQYLAHKFCLAFLVIALLGAFADQLFTASTNYKIAISSKTPQEMFTALTNNMPSRISLVAVYTGLIGGILAGIMYVFSGGWTRVSLAVRLAFVIMILWMFIHAISAFYEVPPRPSELRGTKGPLVWVSCLILFAGTDKSAWRIFNRLVYIFAYIATGIVLLHTLFFHRFFFAGQAVFFFQGYQQILIWTAPWILLSIKDANIKLSKLMFLALPFAVLFLISFLATGRSFIIINILFTVVLLFKFIKLFWKKPAVYYFLFAFVLLFIVGIAMRIFSGQIKSSSVLLSERLWVDSRSAQYVEFLSQVSVRDLVIGTGPRGTWRWQNRDYAYIDGAYTLMAFNGGLPLVICYIVIMILPAWRVLCKKPSWDYAAPAVVLLLWALALTGLSTYTNPDISIGHYVLCIYAGRCLSYLHSRRSRLSVSKAPVSSLKVAYQSA